MKTDKISRIIFLVVETGVSLSFIPIFMDYMYGGG